jgi:DNA-binding CsgD family transcriptional regulator
VITAESTQRFWSRVNKRGANDCWEWQAARQKYGHGLLSIGGKHHKAHRISYELHVGPIPSGLCVRHKCDNPPCVNPLHLELGTRADNNRDRDERGRHVKLEGEAHGMHKLTDNQVSTIRRLADERVLTRAAIARQFGISEGYLYVLIKRQKRKAAA